MSSRSSEKPGLWEMPYGVRLAVHYPRINRRPLVSADRPWESTLGSYCTLF